MPLLYYTTEYKPERAQAEIQRILLSVGARRISLDFDKQTVVGMSFELETAAGVHEFALPARVDKVKLTLERQGVLRRRDPEVHAASVAWRTLLEWIKLQLAMIETQQAKPDEIFMPYLLLADADNGTRVTVYEAFVAQKGLPAGA